MLILSLWKFKSELRKFDKAYMFEVIKVWFKWISLNQFKKSLVNLQKLFVVSTNFKTQHFASLFIFIYSEWKFKNYPEVSGLWSLLNYKTPSLFIHQLLTWTVTTFNRFMNFILLRLKFHFKEKESFSLMEVMFH